MPGKESILEILFAAAACEKTGRRFCLVVRRLYMPTMALSMETALWSAPQPLLHPCDAQIKKSRHKAEKADGKKYPAHFERLRRIDNQIPQPLFCRQKFSDDHADEAQTDIHFEDAEYGRQVQRQDYFGQTVEAAAAQRFDQFDLIGIGGLENGIQVQYTAENCQRDGGDDDGFHVVAQPHDEDRRHGGFGKAVEYHKVWFQNFAESLVPPEQYRQQNGQKSYQHEAGEGFRQSDADMKHQTAFPVKFRRACEHPGRAAENKSVDPACVRGDFPEGDNKNKKKYLNEQHHLAVLFYFLYI